jgi:hypothetical protein
MPSPSGSSMLSPSYASPAHTPPLTPQQPVSPLYSGSPITSTSASLSTTPNYSPFITPTGSGSNTPAGSGSETPLRKKRNRKRGKKSSESYLDAKYLELTAKLERARLKKIVEGWAITVS